MKITLFWPCRIFHFSPNRFILLLLLLLLSFLLFFFFFFSWLLFLLFFLEQTARLDAEIQVMTD